MKTKILDWDHFQFSTDYQETGKSEETEIKELWTRWI